MTILSSLKGLLKKMGGTSTAEANTISEVIGEITSAYQNGGGGGGGGGGVTLVNVADLGIPTAGGITSQQVETGDGEYNIFLYDVTGYSLFGTDDNGYFPISGCEMVWASESAADPNGNMLGLKNDTLMYYINGGYIAPTDTEFYVTDNK